MTRHTATAQPAARHPRRAATRYQDLTRHVGPPAEAPVTARPSARPTRGGGLRQSACSGRSREFRVFPATDQAIRADPSTVHSRAAGEVPVRLPGIPVPAADIGRQGISHG